VPGDLICIKPEEPQLLHCDAVIVEGSCSVDESMLTGESYPITKVAIEISTNFCLKFKSISVLLR
jgi:cation-transporting P-type ATPase 13A2